MTIKITSDSTCDLSPELISLHNIELFPLTITMGGREYRDGVDLFPDDIFAFVNSGGALPATAAVNPATYLKRFSALRQEYDAVIHISIGSEFSCCHQNAQLIAADLDNVYVIDSRNLSSGQGHIVMEAATMAEQGMGAPEIVECLHNLTSRVEASFIMDRLDYMQKGGRCSAVTALSASMLRLKPCIEVIDGQMRVGKKYRGAFEKCVTEYVYDRLSKRNDIIYERIFITHPHATPSAIAAAEAAIRKCADFRQIIETRAGCTVSSHCGPNTLGILFIRSK